MGPKGPRPEGQAAGQPGPEEPCAPRRDADLLRPFLVTGRGVYMGLAGPQGAGRAPARPGCLEEQGGPRRPSAPAGGAERTIRYPHVVELGLGRAPAPQAFRQGGGAEGPLPRPFWETDPEAGAACTESPRSWSRAPRPPSTGTPVPPAGKESPQRPRPVRAAARIAILREGGFGPGSSTTLASSGLAGSKPASPPRSQASGPEAALAHPGREAKPRRTPLPDQKGRGATSPQRGRADPGTSASSVQPPVDDPAAGLQPAVATSAAHQGPLGPEASTWRRAQLLTSALEAEGQAWRSPDVDRYSAASETKPCKTKVYASITKLTGPLDAPPKRTEVKKTPRFNLNPPDAVDLCAVTAKSPAEGMTPCQTMLSTGVVSSQVSPLKVVCQHPGIVDARGNSSQSVHLLGPPVVTSIVCVTTSPLVAQGPVTRVLAASSDLMTKEANLLVDAFTRKITFARSNRDPCTLSANRPPVHPVWEEPQVLPKLEGRESDRPVPHACSVSVVSSSRAQVSPGELMASDDPRPGHLRRPPPALRSKGKNKLSSTPGKFPRLGKRHQRR